MSVDELAKVGEILANLSGDAYRGYVLYIAYEIFACMVSAATWCAFFYTIFISIKVYIDNQAAKGMLDKVRLLLNESSAYRHLYKDRDECEITDALNRLVIDHERLKREKRELEGDL